ncbi:MAG: MerR family transcriptional regulator [Sediminibacterium sp.]|nr:MerR family transcriptional regulator [Sediminibacterium sp.]
MQNSKLSEVLDTKSLEALTGLMDTISEERFKGKILGISYRLICHWSDMEIIRFSKADEAAKRRYSFVDYVWIKVVEELRAINVSIPVIQNIAKEVYTPLPTKEIFSLLTNHPTYEALLAKLKRESDKQDFVDFLMRKAFLDADFSGIANKFNYLHSMIADIIVSRKPVSIVVFKNGDWMAYAPDKVEAYSAEQLYLLENTSQIRINLTQIVFRFMVQEYGEVFINSANLLTEQELRVLEFINTTKFRSVKVFFKDKGIAPVELRGKMVPEQLQRIFQEGKYSRFVITDTKNRELTVRADSERVRAGKGGKTSLIQ